MWAKTAETITIQHDSDDSVLTYVASLPTDATQSTKEYAKSLVSEKWGESHWYSFDRIISKESRNWTVTTEHNPSLSSAYGLGGFLDSTWDDVGCVKTADEKEQIRCTVLYIESRYGNPIEAWRMHGIQNWY